MKKVDELEISPVILPRRYSEEFLLNPLTLALKFINYETFLKDKNKERQLIKLTRRQ